MLPAQQAEKRASMPEHKRPSTERKLATLNGRLVLADDDSLLTISSSDDLPGAIEDGGHVSARFLARDVAG
jgi:hypothetical protein